MANRTQNTAHKATAISSPIPLLAFLGMIVEGVVGALIYTLRSPELDTWILGTLVIAAVSLPVLFGGSILFLLTRHHHKLYAPRDFANPEDFVRVLGVDREGAEHLKRLHPPAGPQPWAVSGSATAEQLQTLQQRVDVWQPVLDAMNPQEFMAMHSWYNERNDHLRALLTINIAIARGSTGGNEFAFRAASLRKLGRTREARNSAVLALEMNGSNVDAHYNLAQTQIALGEREAALKHARIVLERDPATYGNRLRSVLPELGSELAAG